MVTGLEFWAPCDSVGTPQLGVWSAADTALCLLVYGPCRASKSVRG